jgi:glycosyltransferase involved in cell wall biosynthesis
MEEIRKMKKILYLITQSELGGTQRYVFDLASNLKDKYEIAVASGLNRQSDNLLAKCEEIGLKTHEFTYLIREISPKKDYLALLELLSYLKREKPDILHLNSTKAGCLGAVAAWLCKIQTGWKIKVVYTAHGWVFLEPLKNSKRLAYLWAEKIAGYFRDATIVLSQKECAEALKKRLAKPAKLFVIQNGINYEAMSFFIENKSVNILGNLTKINLTPEDLIIGTVANLYPTKGLEFLIDAARKVIGNNQSATSNRKIVFVVVGEGEERKNLEEMIKKNNLENNFFLVGTIPAAYKLLLAFDTIVVPSVKEGMPYAILEAMAAERAIIATDVGGIPEMIKNGESGIIVEPKNPDALAKQILDLCNNSLKRKALGEGALRKLKENYGLQKMISETEKIYL